MPIYTTPIDNIITTTTTNNNYNNTNNNTYQLKMRTLIFAFFFVCIIQLAFGANKCGKDWSDAHTHGTVACPKGVDSECPAGQKCYADV